MLNNLKFILSLTFLLLNFPITVYAIDITLQWAPNNEPNLAGYRVFYREQSQPYDYENPCWESIDPVCTIYDLDETKTYCFVVRAFDTNGLESANSNEACVSKKVTANQTPIENSSVDDTGCFIATADYGSLMAPHVRILSDLQDHFLFGNAAGDSFVCFYHTNSTPIADFIADHDRMSIFPSSLKRRE